MILFYIITWLALASLYVATKGGLSNIARKRLYKSGTIWCAWRWTDVESEYILRLHVVKTPWFAVCLHWIRKPDQEPWLHDHPVSFLSLVLRGGYAERRWNPKRGEHVVLNSWFNFIRASKDDRHRIMLCRANTLTLCFMGPKTREWGFHMNDGWVFWKDYYARLKAGENMRREDRLQAFEKELNVALDQLTRDRSFSRVTIEDTDGKPIDLMPAAPYLREFDDEAPTEPYK